MGFSVRWSVELDIRSIKCSLGMDALRAKTPERVRAEFWSCLLAYNLIRAKMLQSCATSGRDPRSLSFTTTMQLLGSNNKMRAYSISSNKGRIQIKAAFKINAVSISRRMK